VSLVPFQLDVSEQERDDALVPSAEESQEQEALRASPGARALVSSEQAEVER